MGNKMLKHKHSLESKRTKKEEKKQEEEEDE